MKKLILVACILALGGCVSACTQVKNEDLLTFKVTIQPPIQWHKNIE